MLVLHSFAQDTSSTVQIPLLIRASFLYDMPLSFGAVAGVEIPLNRKIIADTKGNDSARIKNHDLIAGAETGFYRYAFNNTGLYFFASAGKRYSSKKPAYCQWQINLGILRTIYDGIVYAVNANNEVSILQNSGRFYALTGFSVVFGHDLRHQHHARPFSIEAGPLLWLQYPYNSYVLPHLSAKLGVAYYFQPIQRRIKQKTMKKIPGT